MNIDSPMTDTNTAREALVQALLRHPWIRGAEPFTGVCPTCRAVIHGGWNSPSHAEHLADAILASGLFITTAEETK